MNRTIFILSLFAIACGGPAAAEPESTEPSAGNEEPASSAPAITGQWIVGGQPFVPEVALAYTNADGSYEIDLSSPAVDCEYARNGGNVPPNLRSVLVHQLRWEAGTAVQSSGQEIENQVVFAYDDPEGGQRNFLANGTVTPGELPTEAGGTIEIAAGDGEDAPQNDAHGTVQVTLCP